MGTPPLMLRIYYNYYYFAISQFAFAIYWIVLKKIGNNYTIAIGHSCQLGGFLMDNKYSQKYKEIGLKIAYYRKLKGYSQLELAEMVDISRTHLSNIEAPNIHTSVSLELLFKLSDVLDVNIKNFFEFTDK